MSIEPRVRLDDCCSAAKPCSHQKRDPYSLCETCAFANQEEPTSDPLAPTPSPGSHADLDGLSANQAAIEAMAEHLLEEDYEPGLTWPEHADDDGYRGGGYVSIAPSDIQARCREKARRVLGRAEQIARRHGRLVSRSAPGAVGLAGLRSELITERNKWMNGHLETDRARCLNDVLRRIDAALAASPTAPAGEPVAEDRVTSDLVAREAFVAIFLSNTPSHDGHREEAELAWKIGDPSCADFFDLAYLIASNIRPLYEAPTAPAQGGDCWRPIETAPRDGTRFWGKVDDDAISMLWHEGFEAFVSTWRRMQMAAGYTINGKPFEDHSPTAHRPKYWMPMPASPSKTQEG